MTALRHLRSDTANKRPDPTALSSGQLAINYEAGSPGLFFKDSAGNLVKAGPVHIGTSAPNATPAAGGSTGNAVGEFWLDTTGGAYNLKVWDGTAWRSAAGEYVNITGDTMTGDLTLNNANLVFEGATADAFETTLTVVDPTADRTITLPNVSGTVVTTGDTGTVTSTMIADGTIVNADVSASAAIAHSKLASMTAGQVLLGNASNVPTSTTVTGDVTISDSGVTSIAAGAIVNADISASAEIAVSKLADGAARQLLQTDAAGTGVEWTNNVDIPGTLDVTGAATFDGIAQHPVGSAAAPTITFVGDTNTGIYSPGADQLALSTGGTGRLFVDASGNVGVGTSSPQEELHIAAASQPYIQVQSTGGVAGSAFYGYNSSTGSASIESTGSIRFAIPGSEAACIDSSGRLLVGTSTSTGAYYDAASDWQGIFQVARSDQNAVASFSIWNSTASTYTNYGGVQLHLSACRSGTVGSHTSGALSSGDTIGSITFDASDGTNFRNSARIEAVVDGSVSTGDVPGRLVFSTTADGASSPTERYRITQDGRHIYYNTGYLYPNTDNAAQLGGPSNRFTAVYAANGSIQTSDRREKTDIEISSLGSNFIKSLRPVSYKWIEGGKRCTGERDEDNNYIYESVPGQRTHWGFIAQEVKQAVDAAGVDFGGWVLTNKDDPDSQQALRYDQFIAPLTKALQETMAEVEALKAEVAALKAQ